MCRNTNMPNCVLCWCWGFLVRIFKFSQKVENQTDTRKADQIYWNNYNKTTNPSCSPGLNNTDTFSYLSACLSRLLLSLSQFLLFSSLFFAVVIAIQVNRNDDRSFWIFVRTRTKRSFVNKSYDIKGFRHFYRPFLPNICTNSYENAGWFFIRNAFWLCTTTITTIISLMLLMMVVSVFNFALR